MPTPFSINLQYDGKSVQPNTGKMTFYDEFYIDVNVEDIALGQRIKMTLHPKQTIQLQQLEIEIPMTYATGENIFCNGYQSWTESKEYTPQGQIPNLKWPAKNKWKYQGDYQNKNIQRGPGQLHSWTYTYIRRNKKLAFFGSLNEHTGFTIFQHECNRGWLKVQLDLDELKLEHSYPAIDIVILEGKETAVFDQYFQLMNVPELKAPPLTGWTSWYHYFTNISEDIILKNLAAFAEKETPIDLFQIDDGYQQAVGDWMKIKPSFPNGMAHMAHQIKSKGYKAGIWLAPFICTTESDIFKNKQNWILKDSAGQLVKAGYNKNWGGWYYALDFYNKEVKDYISGVCITIFEKWNFDLIKLDFLYAACLAPPPTKTRGQIMCEAMDFLRNIAGDKWLLACGVPLGAAFGRVDYCRIGGDVHMNWEDKWLAWNGLRERTSTLASIHATLGRWQLNGRAFHNDPDVFILREDKNKLSQTQQNTLLLVNRLLGNLLFTSDYVGDYSTEQWCEFEEAFLVGKAKDIQVTQIQDETFLIHFTTQSTKWQVFINLKNKINKVNYKQQEIALQAHESLLLLADNQTTTY